MNTLVALLILGCAVFCVAEGWKVERYRNNKTRIKLGVFMRRSRNDPGYTRGHAQGICKHHKASLITNMRVIRNFGGYLSRRWNKKSKGNIHTTYPIHLNRTASYESWEENTYNYDSQICISTSLLFRKTSDS
ncbi:uncharacterized protein LOC117319139 isoform X2 [Pecten maximus]|uniref:uncharacterized protein LOC117319139 isoform X2 n=1 Tax=Pecten maximus TaxID=6579 RepID=UPI001458EA01|nr:uncharacterized protein LOC117319139 isoform X2 [Pecten maximus]